MVAGPFKLIVNQGPRPSQEYELTNEVYVLGREAGNDLVIEDSQISRRHARLTRQGSSYLIEDLSSTNGTFVNGRRIAAPTLLSNGDKLGLADTVLLSVVAPMPTLGSDETLVGGVADALGATAVNAPVPTQPAFAPPPPPPATRSRQPVPPPPPPARSVMPPPPPQAVYMPPPGAQAAYMPPPAMQPAGTHNTRRTLLIGCGCLILILIVVVIALVAWSFIDCKSFSSIFKFLFPPLAC